jgi:DNA polymerase-3 subunit delta'
MMSSPESGADALQGFHRALRKGRLAHAYLVTAPDRQAGRVFCETLLQHLLCESEKERPCHVCAGCRRILGHVHPDVVWVEPESRARQITIERVREIVLPLAQQTPFMEGGWRAVVLLEAEGLNIAAANALLKTLEEPPPRTLLLLVTSDPSQIPPTVVSRCQRLRLEARSDAKDEWRERTLSILAAPTRGSGLLERLARVRVLCDLLDEARQAAVAEADDRQTAADQSPEREETKTEREIVEARVNARVLAVRDRILETVELWQRDIWVCTLGGMTNALALPTHENALRAAAARYTVAEALDALRGVETMRRRLERNLPAESMIEAFMQALPAV